MRIGFGFFRIVLALEAIFSGLILIYIPPTFEQFQLALDLVPNELWGVLWIIGGLLTLIPRPGFLIGHAVVAMSYFAWSLLQVPELPMVVVAAAQVPIRAQALAFIHVWLFLRTPESIFVNTSLRTHYSNWKSRRTAL